MPDGQRLASRARVVPRRHPSGQAPWAMGFFPKRSGSMFSRFPSRLVNFLKAEDGPTAVEYAVMLALIIAVCIASITALGSNASNTFDYVGNTVNTASS